MIVYTQNALPQAHSKHEGPHVEKQAPGSNQQASDTAIHALRFGVLGVFRVKGCCLPIGSSVAFFVGLPYRILNINTKGNYYGAYG